MLCKEQEVVNHVANERVICSHLATHLHPSVPEMVLLEPRKSEIPKSARKQRASGDGFGQKKASGGEETSYSRGIKPAILMHNFLPSLPAVVSKMLLG